MGKHDAQINKLWQGDDDRKIAHAFVAKFGGTPGMEDRIPAMLQEAAATADRIAAGHVSMDDGRAYLSSFAQEGLGVGPHIMSDLGAWFDNPRVDVASTGQPAAEPSAPQPAPAAQPPATASARPATAAPTRGQLQQEIARHQANMRAPEGSPEWRAYWKDGGSADYLAALQAVETAEASPTLATLAGSTAAPVPTQPG